MSRSGLRPRVFIREWFGEEKTAIPRKCEFGGRGILSMRKWAEMA